MPLKSSGIELFIGSCKNSTTPHSFKNVKYIAPWCFLGFQIAHNGILWYSHMWYMSGQ